MDSSASTVASNANLNNVQSQMMPDYASAIEKITDITNSNNAQARLNADEQRSWTERMARQTNEFNAAEAVKNRDWQAMMSNTAHQREIKDLKAAGLNPILSAMGGNGASVTSGATASGVSGSSGIAETDKSGNASIMSLMGNMLTAQTRLAEMATSAATNIAVADKYTSVNEIIAQIQAATSRDVASTHASATRDAAGISASATRDSAATHAQASRDVESAREAHDENMRKSYPSSVAGIASALTGPSGGISSALDAVIKGGQDVVGTVKDGIDNAPNLNVFDSIKLAIENSKKPRSKR